MKLDKSTTTTTMMSGPTGESEGRDDGAQSSIFPSSGTPLPLDSSELAVAMVTAGKDESHADEEFEYDSVTSNPELIPSSAEPASTTAGHWLPPSGGCGFDPAAVAAVLDDDSFSTVIAASSETECAAASARAECASSSSSLHKISLDSSAPPLNHSLEVENIDKLKLSSNSLVTDGREVVVRREIDDEDDDEESGDGGVVESPSPTEMELRDNDEPMGTPSVERTEISVLSSSFAPLHDDHFGDSPHLAESLCCVAVADDCETDDDDDDHRRGQRRPSQQSLGRKCLVFDDVETTSTTTTATTVVVVVSEDEVGRNSSCPVSTSDSATTAEGYVVESSPGGSDDDLIDDMMMVGMGAYREDLSPLQHPNPYPIPHLDTPEAEEAEEGKNDVNEEKEDLEGVTKPQIPASFSTDAGAPLPVGARRDDASYSTPLFERGISPSSVKQNRSATFSASSSSSNAQSTSPSVGKRPSGSTPNASPLPAHVASTPANQKQHPSSSSSSSSSSSLTPSRNYDYILKFLLVGDSDVGKDEILSCLSEEVSESPYDLLCNYKTTTILIDGKRVKLQLWDTSGQGRFCTILRSYSRGAQGILLVYDITNKWSFDGIDRWLKEVDEHAPGVPKILVGNRLHLAYKRQVCETLAEHYAAKNDMAFFEVSPLCDFNIVESFTELSRVALQRNGMARLLKSNAAVSSLQDIAIKAIVARTTVYSIDQLPLPGTLKQTLKSYSIDNRCNQNMRRYLPGPYAEKLNKKSPKPLNPSVASPNRGLARIHSCAIC